MTLDEYRDRMAESHRQFQAQVVEMLSAYGRTQTVFTDTLRAVETHITAIEESNEELKTLILEQGVQLRALRDRLDPP
jgi:hypothetical protein